MPRDVIPIIRNEEHLRALFQRLEQLIVDVGVANEVGEANRPRAHQAFGVFQVVDVRDRRKIQLPALRRSPRRTAAGQFLLPFRFGHRPRS